MRHLQAERYDPAVRERLLRRFREYLDSGYTDPELLYLGGRYATSLGMESEARRFLEPLERQLVADGKPCPAYAPVGLLLLKALPPGDRRDAVGATLGQLRSEVPGLGGLLRRLGLADGSPAPRKSPATLLKRFLDEHRDKLPSSLTEQAKLADLAHQAGEAYQEGRLDESRAALEKILITDGDQPEVLRNCLTVAGEQQDVEAYERYWRRYVRVLLWRMVRGDDAAAAWQDLRRFYLRVATVTDHQLSGPSNELIEVLRRPGFLGRWLESHAALVWLEAAPKSRRQLQTGLDAEEIAAGRLGQLALLSYWLRVFYPDFQPFLRLGDGVAEMPPVASRKRQSRLSFDPGERLMLRFLEWSRFQFALEDREGAHAEAVQALAGCVARLPAKRYLCEIAHRIDPDVLQGQTVPQVLKASCGLVFRLRLSDFFEGEDWPGLVRHLGDPEIFDALDAELGLFLALGLCRSEREEEGLDVACRVLPEMTTAELEEDAQASGLWRSVLAANLGRGLPEETEAICTTILAKLEAIPVRKESRRFLEERIAEVRTRLQIDQTIRRSQDRVGEEDFDGARDEVNQLPDQPREVRELKEQLLAQIEQAERASLLNQRVEDAVNESRQLVEDEDFSGARRVMRRLPDSPDELRDLKKNLLGQIDQAEEAMGLHQRIEAAIERSKKLVAEGDFRGARRVVRGLPDIPNELRELKKNLLDQIDQAKEAGGLNQRIEEAVKKSKRLVEGGNFDGACRVVRGLPDSPDELRDLKKNLLDQIDQAEEAAGLNQRIEEAVKEAKNLAERMDFNGARRVVRQLPDSPAEVREIKQNFLGQIDQAENHLLSLLKGTGR